MRVTEVRKDRQTGQEDGSETSLRLEGWQAGKGGPEADGAGIADR